MAAKSFARSGDVFAICGLFSGPKRAGHRHYNEEQQTHSQPQVAYAEYVASGDFIESVFENWESEFLQMGMYVILTAFLYKKVRPNPKNYRAASP